jgi:hypothetical protein
MTNSLTASEKKELESLRKFKAKVEPVLHHIYDVFYFDSDQDCFDPDKECDSACDFLEDVSSEIGDLYPPPKRGSKKYPPMKGIK